MPPCNAGSDIGQPAVLQEVGGHFLGLELHQAQRLARRAAPRRQLGLASGGAGALCGARQGKRAAELIERRTTRFFLCKSPSRVKIPSECRADLVDVFRTGSVSCTGRLWITLLRFPERRSLTGRLRCELFGVAWPAGPDSLDDHLEGCCFVRTREIERGG